MEPPKIIREADPQEGRGCWMGCFGIGCLIIVVGFFGLLVGGWYSMMHTRLPLILIEQAIEEDGKVKIEGLSGSVSKGVHIDEIKFLTVDDEHWSELHGIKFDYNGLMQMSRTGRFIVEQMSVDRGTIYADIEGPDDFLFSPSDLNEIEEFKDSDLTELRVKLLEVNNLKIINLDTDYSVEIETASLKDFVANGKDGIVDLGQLTIKSNVLEAETEASPKWPESPTAKRIRGKLHAKFSDQMKQDVDFAVDLDFEKSSDRRAVSMFNHAWVQEFSAQQRMIQLTDFSPADYFDSDQILPGHIQLVATHAKTDVEKEETRSEDNPGSDITWELAPGASFQLGKTTFQIESVAGNRAPLRSIVGKASVNGEPFSAELLCRDYFQKGRIDLKVDGQTADRTDWAQVVFGNDFESLSRDDQRVLEATIEASKVKSEPADPDSDETEDQKAEKEESTESLDDANGKTDSPTIEKIPQTPNAPEKDDG